MEGRLGEYLEDKLFFHYPHLVNTAKNYSWIAAPVIIPFMVVMVVVVVVVIAVVVNRLHKKDRPSDAMNMRYVLT